MKKILSSVLVASFVLASCTAGNQDSSVRVSTAPKDIESPVFGKADSKVEVKIFSDYQCPACQVFHELVEPKLRKDYADAGKIALVYKNFPLPQHQNAPGDAVASLCALPMGKYHEFSDKMYAFETSKANADVTDAERIEVAKSAGITDAETFGKCLSENWYLGRVDKDMAEGERLGLNRTPSIYVNDRIMEFKSVEEFFAILDASIAAAK